MFMKSNWPHGRRIFRFTRYGSTLGWATNGWDVRSATTTMTLSGRFGRSQQPTLELPCSPRPINLERKLMVVMAVHATSHKIGRDR